MSKIIKSQQLLFKNLLAGFVISLTFILPVNSVFNLSMSEVQGQLSQQVDTTGQTNGASNTSLLTNSSSSIFRFPTLVVVTNVTGGDNNTNVNASSFPQVVTNEYITSDGFAIAYHFTTGSETGINMNLRPGTYVVADASDNTTTILDQTYNTTYAGDCIGVPSVNNTVIGVGLISVGDAQICSVTKSLR